MGGKIPEHIDVRLDKAEVDPDRVDVEQVTEHAVGNRPTDVLHGRRVAVGVVDHEYPIGIRCGAHHLAATSGVSASGFSTRTCLRHRARPARSARGCARESR